MVPKGPINNTRFGVGITQTFSSTPTPARIFHITGFIFRILFRFTPITRTLQTCPTISRLHRKHARITAAPRPVDATPSHRPPHTRLAGRIVHHVPSTRRSHSDICPQTDLCTDCPATVSSLHGPICWDHVDCDPENPKLTPPRYVQSSHRSKPPRMTPELNRGRWTEDAHTEPGTVAPRFRDGASNDYCQQHRRGHHSESKPLGHEVEDLCSKAAKVRVPAAEEG